MDVITDNERESVYVVALYGVVSFVCVMLVVLFLYVTCARKYRLNWFEKNLLESADVKTATRSREALVGGARESSTTTSDAGRPCPSSTDKEKFWLPHNLQRQNSLCQSDNESSQDYSTPASPTSSTSYPSAPFSGSVPLARNDSQVVLASGAPGRPRVSSMQAKLDHTKIDSSLYKKESPGEPEDVRGTVHLSLAYDPVACILTVKLLEALDLRARDFSGTADPYAKVRLLPDKTNVWQTRIHKRTLNPVFDEDFVFEVRASVLPHHTLEVLLYDFDAYSRHHRIGVMQVPLFNVDLSEKVDVLKHLVPHVGRDPKVDHGELMVSLAYLPSAERLTVVVMKARNLTIVDDTRSSSDPFVKVSLVQGAKRLKKRKTGVHRNTTNPVFNEALTFDVGKELLKKCCLEFCVMHDSLLGASDRLGVCRVGRSKECTAEEKSFFSDMLHSKTATARWLTLSDSRSSS